LERTIAPCEMVKAGDGLMDGTTVLENVGFLQSHAHLFCRSLQEVASSAHGLTPAVTVPNAVGCAEPEIEGDPV
jgi:hypothetical protein